MSQDLPLNQAIDRLLLQADFLPVKSAIAHLRRRADLIERTPLKHWPKGVTVADWEKAQDRLRARAKVLSDRMEAAA